MQPTRKVTLTPKGIEALKPPSKSKITVWDADTKHLALRVSPSGHKSSW